MRTETEARLASPGGWGRYGSYNEHLAYLMPVARVDGRSRCSFCWKARPAGAGWRANVVTHHGMCNGVVLVRGCEWHMRQWAREAL